MLYSISRIVHFIMGMILLNTSAEKGPSPSGTMMRWFAWGSPIRHNIRLLWGGFYYFCRCMAWCTNWSGDAPKCFLILLFYLVSLGSFRLKLVLETNVWWSILHSIMPKWLFMLLCDFLLQFSILLPFFIPLCCFYDFMALHPMIKETQL